MLKQTYFAVKKMADKCSYFCRFCPIVQEIVIHLDLVFDFLRPSYHCYVLFLSYMFRENNQPFKSVSHIQFPPRPYLSSTSNLDDATVMKFTTNRQRPWYCMDNWRRCGQPALKPAHAVSQAHGNNHQKLKAGKRERCEVNWSSVSAEILSKCASVRSLLSVKASSCSCPSVPRHVEEEMRCWPELLGRMGG